MRVARDIVIKGGLSSRTRNLVDSPTIENGNRAAEAWKADLPKAAMSAAQRVMQNITRFVEAKLKLVVNRQKSKAAYLSDCTFLGFQIRRGSIVWTDKAFKRFKERIEKNTSRSRGWQRQGDCGHSRRP